MSDEKVFKGSIGKQIVLQPSDEEHVLVSLETREVIKGPSGRDDAALIVAGTLFQHLFQPGFSPHMVEEDNAIIMVEIPKKYLRPEWQAVVDNHPNAGGEFKLERGGQSDQVFPVVIDTDVEEE